MDLELRSWNSSHRMPMQPFTSRPPHKHAIQVSHFAAIPAAKGLQSPLASDRHCPLSPRDNFLYNSFLRDSSLMESFSSDNVSQIGISIEAFF